MHHLLYDTREKRSFYILSVTQATEVKLNFVLRSALLALEILNTKVLLSLAYFVC